MSFLGDTAKGISIWIHAIRPKTLTAIFVPISFGAEYSIKHTNINYTALLVIIYFGVSIQVLTNLVNDLYDFKKGADKLGRLGPRRMMQSNLVSLNEMKFAIGLTTALAMISGIKLSLIGGYYIFILILISISLAYLYTASKYALAYHGIGDVFVFLFFGPIASGTTAYLLLDSFQSEATAIGIAPGLLATAILAANNIRDYATDLQSKKKTLVVRFGKRFGKIEYQTLIVLAACFHVWAFREHSPILKIVPTAVIGILFVYVSLGKIMSEGENKKLLPLTSLFLLIYGVVTLIFWD